MQPGKRKRETDKGDGDGQWHAETIKDTCSRNLTSEQLHSISEYHSNPATIRKKKKKSIRILQENLYSPSFVTIEYPNTTFLDS